MTAVALITGGSRGLGHAVAQQLAGRGWVLVVDGRDADDLRRAQERLGAAADVHAVPGDVGSSRHRGDLARVVARYGRLDLMLNNASTLGPSPLPPLVDHPVEELVRVLATNTVAPLALVQLVLPALRSARGAVVDVTSDAAVVPYPGWGGYGASKAALDQLTAVLAVELPELAVYAFDPGDMRTRMHQEAFPDEDISDRPPPEAVVPALLRLLDERPASGRYRAADLAAPAATT